MLFQADVLQAAKDISSILAEEKSKKKKVLHPNEMAALALTLNPVKFWHNSH
jgi:predicted transcriptional regulator